MTMVSETVPKKSIQISLVLFPYSISSGFGFLWMCNVKNVSIYCGLVCWLNCYNLFSRIFPGCAICSFRRGKCRRHGKQDLPEAVAQTGTSTTCKWTGVVFVCDISPLQPVLIPFVLPFKTFFKFLHLIAKSSKKIKKNSIPTKYCTADILRLNSFEFVFTSL